MKKIKTLFYRVAQLIAFGTLFTVIGFSQDTNPNHEHPLDVNDLPFEVEMRRLDAVAEELKADSSKMVLLVGFNKYGRSKQTALSRLGKSKNYLATRYHISRSRIRTLYGGSQDGMIMKILVGKKSELFPQKTWELVVFEEIV